MKFARWGAIFFTASAIPDQLNLLVTLRSYLQDTQTPEWKKAYIDYRGLKAQLGVIQAKASRHADSWSSFGYMGVDYTRFPAPNDVERYNGSEGVCLDRGSMTSARIARLWISGADPIMNGITETGNHGPASSLRQRMNRQEISPFSVALASHSPRVTGEASNTPFRKPLLLPRTHRSASAYPRFKDSVGAPTQPSLHTMISNLPLFHVTFFDMLDAELDKVETFYAERAKEMHERAKLLRKQLEELGIHRQLFYETSAHSKAQSWAKRAYRSVGPALSSMILWFRETKPGGLHQTRGNAILTSNSELGRRGFVNASNTGTRLPQHKPLSGDRSKPWRKPGVASRAFEMDFGTASSPTLNNTSVLPSDHWIHVPSLPSCKTKQPLNPLEYQYAKRQLRNAVVEHYRGLEALNSYRILNLTGFRKVLRKYGKITKTPVFNAYMKEKVEPCAFASGATVSTMLKEIEQLFTTQFEHGDKKKAMGRLRVEPSSETHYSSTFHSGLWLGIALPAIAGGTYLSFQEHTRSSLPSWNILLFIYSVFVIPVLLALLIGVNIFVWEHMKISYVFIFKLNPRSRLDCHEYLTLPSFLLCTLAYAFWFSLAQIGSPMLWPLIWLALALAIVFNPLRGFMWGRARWWTIKKIAQLGVSGMWKVEFTDIWLGDQFCSLVYSLSNLYFVTCFYTRFSVNFPSSTAQLNSSSSLYASSPVNATSPYQAESPFFNSALRGFSTSAYTPQAQEAWGTCGITQNWKLYYLLGLLPYLVRLVQSVRRYWDSKRPGHLLNAGKYGTGMINFLFYCYWRHQNNPRTGKVFILWCFTSTVNAIYSCAWDFLMDWGLFKPHAHYPLLRPELVYKSHIPCYYFTLVSDVCIRFLWVVYMFVDKADFELYAFTAAMLEMLRRVQWNFYRLENKHLHNSGLHRITRQVPLPYRIDAHDVEEEALLKKRIAHLS